MTEADIQVFVEGTMDYFMRVSRKDAFLDTPYLRTNENVILDYTGAISISGQERGCVMFTARQEMLSDLMHGMGETDLSDENLRDMVGEVANTISGNARKQFGTGFFISVPFVFDGQTQLGHLNDELRTFVIPVIWNEHKSYLLVAIQP